MGLADIQPMTSIPLVGRGSRFGCTPPAVARPAASPAVMEPGGQRDGSDAVATFPREASPAGRDDDGVVAVALIGDDGVTLDRDEDNREPLRRRCRRLA